LEVGGLPAVGPAREGGVSVEGPSPVVTIHSRGKPNAVPRWFRHGPAHSDQSDDSVARGQSIIDSRLRTHVFTVTPVQVTRAADRSRLCLSQNR